MRQCYRRCKHNVVRYANFEEEGLRIGCFSPYILGQDPQKRRRRRVFKYGAVQTILARYLITNDSRRNGLPVESFRRRSQVIKARKKVSKYY